MGFYPRLKFYSPDVSKSYKCLKRDNSVAFSFPLNGNKVDTEISTFENNAHVYIQFVLTEMNLYSIMYFEQFLFLVAILHVQFVKILVKLCTIEFSHKLNEIT